MKNAMIAVTLIMVAMMLVSCGGGGGDSGPTQSEPFTLALAVQSVTATSTTLALTSNFNCIDCPIYKDGIIYSKITTQSNVPALFVVSNSSACYRSGGLFFLGGNVWSNLLCIP